MHIVHQQYCAQCNEELVSGGAFCVRCGAKVARVQSAGQESARGSEAKLPSGFQLSPDQRAVAAIKPVYLLVAVVALWPTYLVVHYGFAALNPLRITDWYSFSLTVSFPIGGLVLGTLFGVLVLLIRVLSARLLKQSFQTFRIRYVATVAVLVAYWFVYIVGPMS